MQVNNKTKTDTLIKRPLWILMAVLCIVFSSASKKLIVQKLSPYLTVSQSISKKIKDGSRNKHQYLSASSYSVNQSEPETDAGINFYVTTLFTFALFSLNSFNKNAPSFVVHSERPGECDPLFLQFRKLLI